MLKKILEYCGVGVGVCEQVLLAENFQDVLFGFFKNEKIIMTAPIVIYESARLKTGHIFRSTKSITQPKYRRSIKLLIAPAIIRIMNKELGIRKFLILKIPHRPPFTKGEIQSTAKIIINTPYM